MMYREQHIGGGAVLFSVLLHAALFFALTNTSLYSRAGAPHFMTRVSLNLLPPPVQPPHIVAAESPPPTTRAAARPKPKMKPKPRTTQEITKVTEPMVHTPATAPHVAPKIQREETVDPGPQIKQRYLSYLLTHIEGHKYYPQAARRRGIEGNIQVSFRLLDSGGIHGLAITGGPLVLRQAVERAVHQALPLPAPPPEINCPIQVSYAMQFQLR